MAVYHVGKREGFSGDIVRTLGAAREQIDIDLDNTLELPAAGDDDRRIIVIGVFARGRYHDWNGGFELTDRIAGTADSRIANGKNAARRRRIEAVLAAFRGIAFDKALGRGEPGLKLAGGVERQDARVIEFKGLALRRAPLCNRFAQLPINDRGVSHLVLQDQDSAELGENPGVLQRVVGESDGALDVERGTSQILSLLVTPLFDQNAGKTDDESGSHGRILASRLQDAKESAACVRLGFA